MHGTGIMRINTSPFSTEAEAVGALPLSPGPHHGGTHRTKQTSDSPRAWKCQRMNAPIPPNRLTQ